MPAAPATPARTRAAIRGRRALVLGLARSGLAATRFLSDAGAEVTAYDRRPAGELALGELGGRPVALELGVDPARVGALLDAADIVVTSPSVSSRFPTTEPWLRSALARAEARRADVVSEVALFLRLTAAQIVAVTGTKGKTTTTALLGEILAAAGVPHAVGGNIGTPLIERVDELGPDDWAVLELSELQLPTIDRGADVSVYTNVTADHLDRHRTVEAYRAVKARLAELARGPVVLNAEDVGCRELAERLPSMDARWYGLDRGAARVADGMILLDDAPVMAVADVPLPGEHLLHDVLAAALAASLIGASPDAVASGIRGFAGVPHRLETLGEWNGIRFVNDSQATIPFATIAALGAFGDRGVVLIAGGKDKGLDYAELADAMAEHCRAAVLMGETADELQALLAGRVRLHRATGMPDAVRAAVASAERGDVILLSPAAASFDMFRDYAARGEAFRSAVTALRPGDAE